MLKTYPVPLLEAEATGRMSLRILSSLLGFSRNRFTIFNAHLIIIIAVIIDTIGVVASHIPFALSISMMIFYLLCLSDAHMCRLVHLYRFAWSLTRREGGGEREMNFH